jgi:hypothetical protein
MILKGLSEQINSNTMSKQLSLLKTFLETVECLINFDSLTDMRKYLHGDTMAELMESDAI